MGDRLAVQVVLRVDQKEQVKPPNSIFEIAKIGERCQLKLFQGFVCVCNFFFDNLFVYVAPTKKLLSVYNFHSVYFGSPNLISVDQIQELCNAVLANRHSTILKYG
jgi:hypothetical protein